MDTQKDFFNNGYCIVRSAITKEIRDFVTQYALFDEMQDFKPDGIQVPAAHSKYADPAMEVMLLNLHKTMEEITGLTLHPTYSYFRVYRPDDDLKKHTDRESCEISCTLCFNFSYSDSSYNWPIFMNGNEVALNPGDMVIYRGRELPHWREKMLGGADDWQVQGFFHYVDANGPCSEFKYDRRPSIGYIGPKLIQGEKPYIFYVN